MHEQLLEIQFTESHIAMSFDQFIKVKIVNNGELIPIRA